MKPYKSLGDFISAEFRDKYPHVFPFHSAEWFEKEYLKHKGKDNDVIFDLIYDAILASGECDVIE